MKNLKVLLNSKVIFKINWVKSIISFNLVVMLVVSQISLLPMSVFAATPLVIKEITVNTTFSGKDEIYTAKVEIKGTGSATTALSGKSTLGRQVVLPKNITSGSKFDVSIKCGDTITLTVGKDKKEIKAPACGNEVSSCANPEGWVEEATSRETETLKYYFAKDKKTITSSDTPENNPEAFGGVFCVGGGAYNYKDESGTYQKSDPKLVKEGDFYVSKGTEYSAKFPTNPNLGFSFKTGNESLDISKVEIGKKGIKTNPKIDISGSCITYLTILPEVDLTYCLDNHGITKQLTLLSKAATKNNLSKIEFTLANTTAKKESVSNEKTNQKLSEKVNTASTNITDIEKAKVEAEKLANVAVDTADNTSKTTKEVATKKAEELKALVESMKVSPVKNGVTSGGEEIATELERIENIPSADEKVTLSNGLKLDLPISYSQNNNANLIKAESVSVSKDGKKLTIIPDMKTIKKLDKKSFPYVIDPRFYNETASLEDTYVAQDGTYSVRGWNREVVVGGRPEGGVAAVYVERCGNSWWVNCVIGDAQGYLKFRVPNIPVNTISEAYLNVKQYGSWNTGGFGVEIHRAGWFSEGSLHYYNQPATYSYVGHIFFNGINCSYTNCAENRRSGNIAQALREAGQNSDLFLKLKDDSAVSRSITFCSRNVLPGTPCQNYKEPVLQVYVTGTPTAPVNQGPNYEDKVAGCEGQSCKNSIAIPYSISGLNDGYASCISSNIYADKWEKSSFGEWRWPYYTGVGNSLFWDNISSKRVSDYGATCGGWLGWWEQKLGGTYGHEYRLRNSDGVSSSSSATLFFSVDTSAPVQIEANNTKIPAVKNNGNISMTLPRYIDDARSAVYFKNLEGGVIDTTNSVNGNTKDVSIPAYVYEYSNTAAKHWVIESNGQIRSLADGRCLSNQGGDQQMITKRCEINSSYNTAAYQGYEYLPETKQIRLINDRRWCFAKEGNALMLRICNTANNQKWDVNVVAEPTWAGITDKVVQEENSKQLGTYVNIVNKSVQYRLIATNDADGSWYKWTEWNTNRDVTISGLLDEKKYHFYMQTRDRATGTTNYSYYLLLGSTLMDLKVPEITNYTQTTPIISPNNTTSAGVLDSVTFTYDYKDANPYSAWLDIYPNAGGTQVRRLGYDPTFDPNRNGAILTPNVNRTYYYTWDGRDNNGNFVADGLYKIKAFGIDQTCNVSGQDYNNPLCNKFDEFNSNALTIKVDNTGANISVVTPTYNIWTNNENYVITGGLGVYNKAGKEDKDVSELYVNNVKSPFGTSIANNYSYKTVLKQGANPFTFSTKDQAGNVISKVGDPSTNTIATWIVNYDNTNPKINSILDNTTTGTIKSTKTLKVSFADTLSNVNTSNIVMDLYSSNDAKTFTKSKNLVNAGKLVNGTNAGAFNCTTSECNITLTNLTDAYYKLFVSISDNATNTSCTFMQVPYICNELATFDKVIQVGTPSAGNTTTIDTDTTKGLLSVNIFPTYDGINDATVLSQLQNGTRWIDEVQGLTLKVKVSKGTEAVDLYYTYDTNIANKKIATINGTLDPRPKYRPVALPRNANVVNGTQSYLEVKNTVPQMICDKVECEWTYTIVYDSQFAGGFPKLTVTSYKGINQDSATVKWEVNGQLKGNPRVLTFNKRSGTTLENANVYSNIFYTNTLSNRIEFASDASKSYTITIRNTTNTSYTQNYTFTSDTWGSQYVDVNLPNMDGKYEIVYNGFVVGNFVLDRIVPTLSSVQTTNLSNTKAVMPFIRRGDSVKFDYTTSEPVWDSNLVLDGTQKVFAEKVTAGCTTPAYTLQYAQGSQACNDAWRNSKTNTSTYQINNWQGGASGVDGIVNPKIELVDYAGNKGSYLSAVQTTPVYTQTPRLATTGSAIDFRLFADSISPDKSDFNTTSWKDGKDGVVADGVNPEADRLAEGRWVIRGNTITFKVKGEKNARAVFVNNGVELIANAVYTNCTAGANTVVNGLVVKFAELCDVSFTYNWTGTGSQNELGEAYDYKNFQFYTTDLSGNTSAYSNNVTVYNDRTAPKLGTGNLTSNDANSPITEGFTKSLNIKSTDNGEMKSDVSYSITNPIPLGSGQANITTNQAVIRADNSGNSAANFTLGTLSDERAGCTTTVGTRRVGTCEDGVYKVTTKHTDTSGNMNAGFVKSVERDTVAPAAPKGNVVFDANGYGILNVTTEQNVEILINGIRYTNSDGLGNASVKYLNPNSYLYGSTGTIPVSVRDLARNTSVTTIVKYTTPAPPKYISYCVKSGKVAFPLEKMVDAISVFNEPRTYTNTQGKTITDIHDGLDFSVPTGTKVLAAHDGVVSYGSDSYGGIGIYVNSGSFTTMYWHLSKRSVPEGYQIKQGEIIGLSGESGNVTGAHLHFGFKINGQSYSDPKIQLACEVDDSISKNGNLTLNEKLVQASFTLTDDYDQADVDKATKLLVQADNWPLARTDKWPGKNNAEFMSLPAGLQYDLISGRQSVEMDRYVVKSQSQFTKCMEEAPKLLKEYSAPLSYIDILPSEIRNVQKVVPGTNVLLQEWQTVATVNMGNHYNEIIRKTRNVADMVAYSCGSSRIVTPDNYYDLKRSIEQQLEVWLTSIPPQATVVEIASATIPAFDSVKNPGWELQDSFASIGAIAGTVGISIVKNYGVFKFTYLEVITGSFADIYEYRMRSIPVAVTQICTAAALGLTLGTTIGVCGTIGVAVSGVTAYYTEKFRSRLEGRNFDWNKVYLRTFEGSMDVGIAMVLEYASAKVFQYALPYGIELGYGIYYKAKSMLVRVGESYKLIKGNVGRVGQYVNLQTGLAYDTLENVRLAINFANGDIIEQGGKVIIKAGTNKVAKIVATEAGEQALEFVGKEGIVGVNAGVTIQDDVANYINRTIAAEGIVPSIALPKNTLSHIIGDIKFKTLSEEIIIEGGGHSISELKKIGFDIKLKPGKVPTRTHINGSYEVDVSDLEISYNGIPARYKSSVESNQLYRLKTFFKDGISLKEINRLGNEAIANKSKLIYSGSGNNWYGEANDGTKLILKNSAGPGEIPFEQANSYYPNIY